MNISSLTGRLVDDIRINHTGSGKEVGNGTMAVQRNFKNAQGNYDADFIDFTVWGPKAIVMAEYIKKGDKFGITGELRTRINEYNGNKSKVTEVNVQDFDFPERPKKDSQPKPQSQQENSKDDNRDPFANDGQPINISDDDLPF